MLFLPRGGPYPFRNGTRWPHREVCYRIDPTAVSWTVDIDAAAQAWTNASTGGFEFVKDEGDGCDNYVAEGWIDGYKGWYGYTLIETNQGTFGCLPGVGCIDPPPGSVIERAHTVLESFTCPQEDVECFCGAGKTIHGKLTYNDTLGCGPVVAPSQCRFPWPGPGGGNVIRNVNLLTIGWRWDTPGSYETALHEFGHWLWLGDHRIYDPGSRGSAMDWYAAVNGDPLPIMGQLCGLPFGGGGPPDFYTLFSEDVEALNDLYP